MIKIYFFILIFMMAEACFAQVTNPAFYTLPGSTSLIPAPTTVASEITKENPVEKKASKKKRRPAHEDESADNNQEGDDDKNESPLQSQAIAQAKDQNGQDPKAKEQIRDFILGGDVNYIDEYKKQLSNKT